MKEQSETLLIDLAPKMFVAIRNAQNSIAKWIIPDSGISDNETLNDLIRQDVVPGKLL